MSPSKTHEKAVPSGKVSASPLHSKDKLGTETITTVRSIAKVIQINYSKTKLTMPVHALGAGYHKYEGNVTLPLNISSMEKLAQNVTGIRTPNSGHWIPE